MVKSVSDSLRFMETLAGVGPRNHRVDFFTSHEALHLSYEQAQTCAACPAGRGGTTSPRTFRGSGCAPSIPRGRHVEYMRGIHNPIGIKVGPGDDARGAGPHCSTSSIPATSRDGSRSSTGSERTDISPTMLPPLLGGVKATGPHATVVLRPDARQHRNDRRGVQDCASSSTSSPSWSRRSRSTRDAGTYLGGVHVEVTGEDVTECTGGAPGLETRLISVGPTAPRSIPGSTTSRPSRWRFSSGRRSKG